MAEKKKRSEKQIYCCATWLTESQYDQLVGYCEYKHMAISQFVRILVLNEIKDFRKEKDNHGN